ncbi:MAG: hypothetical protein K0R57_3739 [Paenibacillaceae bacterium]|jgi:hypothetical protein|nr:hypothetical protein [Paenibacillaceae bacterium]
MKLDLIPQPQYVHAHGDNAVSGLREAALVLRLPVPDERLVEQARALFSSVRQEEHHQEGNWQEEHRHQQEVYSLVSEGRTVNARMAERVAGKHDGYVLIVGEHGLELYAMCPSGFYYGLITLEQLLSAGAGTVPAVAVVDWADLKIRSDYLDLRTIYPTFEHILEYIAELARYKINTLTVEYEDKLPFRRHAFLCHPTRTFTPEQHEQLLAAARRHFVRIIPKQQSFGHLEYILKHPAYMKLRATPGSIGELCPHREGSYEMMAGILEEVAELHPDSPYLHMGCDEVWSLGESEECQASGLTREMSFIRFVNRLAAKVCELGKEPMIWHDMLAHASSQELAELDKRITVVIWIYGGSQMKHDAGVLIDRLRQAGIAVMGASAVRCWDDDGEQNYPLIHNRVRNIVNWVEIARREQLPGIINTNWASPFSLGSPYGLFETSRYPAFFAADHCWNAQAESGDFLERFLVQYHGIWPEEARETVGKHQWGLEDYYQQVPRFRGLIRRNSQTAALIVAVLRYELPARKRFPLHTFMFRAELFPGDEEVITCLREKYRTGYRELRLAKEELQQALLSLLPEDMAGLYLASRYYLLELYEEKLLELVPKLQDS